MAITLLSKREEGPSRFRNPRRSCKTRGISSDPDDEVFVIVACCCSVRSRLYSISIARIQDDCKKIGVLYVL